MHHWGVISSGTLDVNDSAAVRAMIFRIAPNSRRTAAALNQITTAVGKTTEGAKRAKEVAAFAH
jgi:hypothetical protein